jgi:hypothetical protein
LNSGTKPINSGTQGTLVYVIILLSFFVKIGTGELGGLFGTFLGIPPQYSTIIPENGTAADRVLDIPIQKTLLPVLYGVMHCVLFSLALLPFGMCRGFARDLLRKFPALPEEWYGIPIDEIEMLHKFWGWVSIGGLVVGCFIWLIMMGQTCLGAGATERLALGGNNTAAQLKACKAFNPDIVLDAVTGQLFEGRLIAGETKLLFDSFGGGASFFDPRDNVLFLRIAAWFVWMFGARFCGGIGVARGAFLGCTDVCCCWVEASARWFQ